MGYDELRHFADSWGLVFLFVSFVGAIGWVFRPGSTYDEHADIPFKKRDERGLR